MSDPMSPRTWQRDILDAAEERDWLVRRLDLNEGVVLEETSAERLTIRIVGPVTAAFIRRLPLGRRPARRELFDGPCWCRFDNPDAGPEHEPQCLERRAA